MEKTPNSFLQAAASVDKEKAAREEKARQEAATQQAQILAAAEAAQQEKDARERAEAAQRKAQESREERKNILPSLLIANSYIKLLEENGYPTEKIVLNELYAAGRNPAELTQDLKNSQTPQNREQGLKLEGMLSNVTAVDAELHPQDDASHPDDLQGIEFIRDYNRQLLEKLEEHATPEAQEALEKKLEELNTVVDKLLQDRRIGVKPALAEIIQPLISSALAEHTVAADYPGFTLQDATTFLPTEVAESLTNLTSQLQKLLEPAQVVRKQGQSDFYARDKAAKSLGDPYETPGYYDKKSVREDIQYYLEWVQSFKQRPDLYSACMQAVERGENIANVSWGQVPFEYSRFNRGQKFIEEVQRFDQLKLLFTEVAAVTNFDIDYFYPERNTFVAQNHKPRSTDTVPGLFETLLFAVKIQTDGKHLNTFTQASQQVFTTKNNLWAVNEPSPEIKERLNSLDKQARQEADAKIESELKAFEELVNAYEKTKQELANIKKELASYNEWNGGPINNANDNLQNAKRGLRQAQSELAQAGILSRGKARKNVEWAENNVANREESLNEAKARKETLESEVSRLESEFSTLKSNLGLTYGNTTEYDVRSRLDALKRQSTEHYSAKYEKA